MAVNQTCMCEFPSDGTFYDLLAVLCYRINILPVHIQRGAYMEFKCRYEKYYQDAITLFPFLSMQGKETLTLYSDMSCDEAIKILSATAVNENINLAARLLAVIVAIDTALDLDYNLSVYLTDKRCCANEDGNISQCYYAFEALNDRTLQCYGKLIPREECIWERKSYRNADTVAYEALSFLKNYIWLPPDSEFKLQNLYTDFKIPEKRGLRIVFSPLSAKAPFLINTPQETTTFEVEYCNNCSYQTDTRLMAVTDYAVHENADIVFFPELMAAKENVYNFIKYIKQNWSCKYPHLILLPTCEYKQNEMWINSLTALDCDGNIVFTYNKQHPFQWDKKCQTDDDRIESRFEPIMPDNMIYVIHVPGIGRIGFMICSGIFKPGYLEYLLGQLKLTLLLHISFSPGKDLLMRKLQYSISKSCDVVLCNTCAAWDEIIKKPSERVDVKINKNDFISVYCPFGHKQTSICAKDVSCGTKRCKGCAFFLELSADYSGIITSPIQTYLGD